MNFERVKCNICGADFAKEIGRRESPDSDIDLETSVVRCNLCGLIYPNPMPCPTKKEVQYNFSAPESYFPGGSAGLNIKRYEQALKMIEKYAPSKGKLLDVGCGRGEFIHAAIERGWDAKGTEISESFSSFAKGCFNIDVTVGDICDLDLTEESFDAITLNSVIQYVPDPMRMLRSIYRLLKKGGILYIEVTNEEALVFTVGDIMKTLMRGKRITTRLSPLFPSYQIFGFGRKSLSKALEGAGFTVSTIEVRGVCGGGRVRGGGFKNFLLNVVRRVIISAGGITGGGHLIYCIARKELQR